MGPGNYDDYTMKTDLKGRVTPRLVSCMILRKSPLPTQKARLGMGHTSWPGFICENYGPTMTSFGADGIWNLWPLTLFAAIVSGRSKAESSIF